MWGLGWQVVGAEAGAEGIGVAGDGAGGLEGDFVILDEACEVLFQGLHTECGAGFDGGIDLLGLAGGDEVGDGWGIDEDFASGDAAEGGVGLGGGEEVLDGDSAEDEGDLAADGFLFTGGEDGDEAFDGADAVAGVEGGEDEVAGFGGGDGGSDGGGVTDFADEDDIGVLAEGIDEGLVKARGIDADLALTDEGLDGEVDIFDGVFDGDDVAVAGTVNLVDEGGEGGGLAGAGGAGDDEEAVVVGAEIGEACGEAEFIEGAEAVFEAAECDGDGGGGV